MTNKRLPIMRTPLTQIRKCKIAQGSTISTRDLPGSRRRWDTGNWEGRGLRLHWRECTPHITSSRGCPFAPHRPTHLEQVSNRPQSLGLPPTLCWCFQHSLLLNHPRVYKRIIVLGARPWRSKTVCPSSSREKGSLWLSRPRRGLRDAPAHHRGRCWCVLGTGALEMKANRFLIPEAVCKYPRPSSTHIIFRGLETPVPLLSRGITNLSAALKPTLEGSAGPPSGDSWLIPWPMGALSPPTVKSEKPLQLVHGRCRSMDSCHGHWRSEG